MGDHTPGKWRKKWVNILGGVDCPAIVGKGGEVVAVCPVNDIAGLGLDDSMARDDANADRLIAPRTEIALDLLAALADLVEQLDGIGIPDWHGAEGLCLKQARAAIQTATTHA